jgi:hypothetical protein
MVNAAGQTGARAPADRTQAAWNAGYLSLQRTHPASGSAVRGYLATAFSQLERYRFSAQIGRPARDTRC